MVGQDVENVIDKVRFSDFRKYDRKLLKNIFDQNGGLEIGLKGIVKYFSSLERGATLDEERLYLLGRDVSSICAEDKKKVFLEKFENADLPPGPKQIFVAGYTGAPLPDDISELQSGKIISITTMRSFANANDVQRVRVMPDDG